MKRALFLSALLLVIFTVAGLSAFANFDQLSGSQTLSKSKSIENDGVIRVYGPGGPLGPIKEVAEKFSSETGIKVIVTAGPETNWIDQAKQDADIIYGGSEYMLRNFMFDYPRMINDKTLSELYPRSAGILVRKGNPKKIQTLEDLTKKGVKIVDVNGAGQLGLWEDLAGRKGLITEISNNIDISVKSSAEAIELWKSNAKLDAWITYESWHYRLEDVTELVELPEEEKLYRGTPIALTNITSNKKEAQRFIDYLKTESSHKVFQKWGWK
ncbi:extracellular solute-binding protein [Bacillus sp. FJAT-29790]|uniref:extracellular solute-binding protein n=1 Tax=Bacillus sp. FJAT-29790 TaxID=1895002 RepID=UPI001C22EDAC|nr:extracellular solute-binding protein [Bacillus sp. FJAT-29790]MBU8878061.1 extracellular solute-binding protein [Bacillus sp. FJAT-29790]